MPLLIGKTRGISSAYTATAWQSMRGISRHLVASLGISWYLVAYLGIALHLSAHLGISRHLALSCGNSWHLAASYGISRHLVASRGISRHLRASRCISWYPLPPEKNVIPTMPAQLPFCALRCSMALPCASSLFYQLPWLWSCSILLSKTWALNHARLQIT